MTRPMHILRLTAAMAVAGVLVAVSAFFLLNALYPFPQSKLHPEAATVVLARDGSMLSATLPPDGQWRFPVTLNEVSPVFLRTIIASEDKRFHDHPGVDLRAVFRAALSNITAGRVVSGASTIPMQIARLVEPKPRTFRSKVIEAFRALQLSWLYSRDELLEIYLNMTPYGGNIVGVGTASQMYFGKPASLLSFGEAALLTALPRSPARYDPLRNPEGAEKGRARVIRRLVEQGVFTEKDATEALQLPLPAKLQRPSGLAPHASRFVGVKYGRGQTHTSTIDRRIQKVAELATATRGRQLAQQGVGNAACVVIDLKTRDVLAMVGSKDFFNPDQGQVNNTLSARSPGSTLKPFLYGRAFDLGVTSPGGLLTDIPTEYAGYKPENYDETYSGEVTARYALAHSLNVPAVRLLQQTEGAEGLYKLLKKAGVGSLKKPWQYYGLGIALGGCETSLLELTAMYAALGNEGVYAKPRLLLKSPEEALETEKATEVRLLSPEATAMVLDILAAVERPDMPVSWELTKDSPAVAWKTGTSFGHRDAWAVGVSKSYAIGVWTGNPDGRPVLGISGARHAAPLLFDLFRALEEPGAPLPIPEEPNIQRIHVCSESRQLPSQYCDNLVEIEIIPGVTQLTTCQRHKRIFVDTETGDRLLGDCLIERPHQAKVVCVLPVELAAWRQSCGLPAQQLPRLSSYCSTEVQGTPPAIQSPSGETPYRLRRDAPVEFQKIPLTAYAASDVTTLHWYIDGQLVAQDKPDARLFWHPEKGEHRLAVMDNMGRLSAVTFVVK